MIEIALNRGFKAIVDDDTPQSILGMRWVASPCRRNGPVYAKGKAKDGRSTYLHREIMEAKKGETVDHINGNPLDCRRSNLRLCQPYQNSANMRISKANTSGRKGVYFRKDTGKWAAQITWRGKKVNLGSFGDRDTAARVRDARARECHGEFASPSEAPRLIGTLLSEALIDHMGEVLSEVSTTLDMQGFSRSMGMLKRVDGALECWTNWRRQAQQSKPDAKANGAGQ